MRRARARRFACTAPVPASSKSSSSRAADGTVELPTARWSCRRGGRWSGARQKLVSWIYLVPAVATIIVRPSGKSFARIVNGSHRADGRVSVGSVWEFGQGLDY